MKYNKIIQKSHAGTTFFDKTEVWDLNINSINHISTILQSSVMLLLTKDIEKVKSNTVFTYYDKNEMIKKYPNVDIETREFNISQRGYCLEKFEVMFIPIYCIKIDATNMDTRFIQVLDKKEVKKIVKKIKKNWKRDTK